MKNISPVKGLSGEISFDQFGNRENFQLEVLDLALDGLSVIGSWHSSSDIGNIKPIQRRLNPYRYIDDGNVLKNKTLIVLIANVSCIMMTGCQIALTLVTLKFFF